LTKVVLAIDTSSGTAVSVLVDGQVASELLDSDSMQHAEQIGSQILKAIEAAGVKAADVSAVAVGVGPGPFTGLRVGIAAAKMFAEGASVPIYAVGSLEAVAFAQPLASPTLVLADARRSEVFFGLFLGKTPAGVPQSLLGPGVRKLAELEAELEAAGQSYQSCLEPVAASSVGKLALARIAEGTANTSVIANYLRAPDASPSKGKKVSG
jgi:tRNA threonylcarbamoyl adenosine modification protein YeaZ